MAEFKLELNETELAYLQEIIDMEYGDLDDDDPDLVTVKSIVAKLDTLNASAPPAAARDGDG